MRKQSISPGAQLPGSVHAIRTRCGKPNCRCRAGQLHGPYFVRYWREQGRLRRQYLRPADVEQIRERCEQWRKMRTTWRAGQAEYREMIRQGRALLRMAERYRGI